MSAELFNLVKGYVTAIEKGGRRPYETCRYCCAEYVGDKGPLCQSCAESANELIPELFAETKKMARRLKIEELAVAYKKIGDML